MQVQTPHFRPRTAAGTLVHHPAVTHPEVAPVAKVADPRLGNLNYLRAYAVALVVLVHASGPPLYAFNTVSRELWWTANIFDSFARTCVPLFVMLSGFLLLDPTKEESLGTFFRKRLAKVVIPYVFWSAMYFLWRSGFHQESLKLNKIFREFMDGTAYYHLTFMNIIVGLYLLTPILRAYVRTADTATQTYAVALWFVLVGVFSCFTKVTGVPICSYLQVTSLFLGHYLFGALCRRVPVQLSRKQIYAAVGLVLALTAATAELTFYYTKKSGGLLDAYFYAYIAPNVILMSMLSFVVLLQVCSSPKVTSQPVVSPLLRFVGATSFGIYLTHVFVLEMLARGTFGFTLTQTTFHPLLSIPLIVAITLGVSAAATAVIQRIPVVRWVIP
jgi:surface polysaccharide O-acyltransferase-like enzyme